MLIIFISEMMLLEVEVWELQLYTAYESKVFMTITVVHIEPKSGLLTLFCGAEFPVYD